MGDSRMRLPRVITQYRIAVFVEYSLDQFAQSIN
jgi:hypothetical protein